MGNFFSKNRNAAVRKVQSKVLTRVTRLGDFWNFLATNFIAKVSQMFV